MRKAILLIIIPFLMATAYAQQETGEIKDETRKRIEKKELPTQLGAVYRGMTKEELYKVFQEQFRILLPHRILDDEWIIFKKWDSPRPDDVITFYLRDGKVIEWKESYYPFPNNRGSAYEHNPNEKIDKWFFPKNESRWNGAQIHTLEWHLLTDAQKAMFIKEYLKELSKEYKTNIEIDVGKYVIAIDYYADTCSKSYYFVPLTKAVKDLLIKNGLLPARD